MIQDKRETHHYSNSAKAAAKRYIHENYVNGFSKKIFFWAKCAIWDPKMIRFLILGDKRGQEVHRNHNNNFFQKIMSFEANCQFWVEK